MKRKLALYLTVLMILCFLPACRDPVSPAEDETSILETPTEPKEDDESPKPPAKPSPDASPEPPAESPAERTSWVRPAEKHFTIEFTAAPDQLINAATETIYSDEYFTHSFNNMTSQYYFIVFDDGTRVPLTEALSTGRVSIEDCIANGLGTFGTVNEETDKGTLSMGYGYKFTINDQPFYPSIYFMLHTSFSDAYFLYDDFYEALVGAGLTEEAQKLSDYNSWHDMLSLCGRLYYTAAMLEEATGITVHYDSNYEDRYIVPFPVRFVTEEYTGDEVLIHSAFINSVSPYDDQPGVYGLPIYEHINATLTDGLFCDRPLMTQEMFERDRWNEFYGKFINGLGRIFARLEGHVMNAHYSVYKKGVPVPLIKDVEIASGDDLVIPEGLGYLTVSMTVKWGVEDRYVVCQYWFGVKSQLV